MRRAIHRLEERIKGIVQVQRTNCVANDIDMLKRLIIRYKRENNDDLNVQSLRSSDV